MTKPASHGSLLVIFLTVFIDLLGFGMVLPLLPIYADQFAEDASGWRLGALMASFSAMQFLFAPLWGRLSDRIGRRPVLMIGLLGSVVFYALFGLATQWQSFLWLFITRIGAGIAGATIPTAQAYIADTTTPENRQKGMALIGMAFGLGFTFGPLFGYLAVPSGQGDPGPWPGYAASLLSAVALLIAVFNLPESLRPDTHFEHRKLLDVEGLKAATAAFAVLAILLALFVCVFSFANFETTLSLLIKGKVGNDATALPFHFTWRDVCLTYAFIGITLAIVQGGIVRRISGRVSEGKLATTGAAIKIAGFVLVAVAVDHKSTGLLFAALAVVVTGFAFLQPSLNSLLSRRTDPKKQGLILGVGQSVNALARILGAATGIPLLKNDLHTPYYVAAALMTVGLALVVVAARGGTDNTDS